MITLGYRDNIFCDTGVSLPAAFRSKAMATGSRSVGGGCRLDTAGAGTPAAGRAETSTETERFL